MSKKVADLRDVSEGNENSFMGRSSSRLGDLESGTESKEHNVKELKDRLIEREEKAVKRSRILVGIAMIICAVAVTVSVYLFSKQGDQRAFEVEYEGFVTDIKNLVKWEVRYNFALMEQLSASVTIAANLKKTVWPFHVEPDAEITYGFVDGMGGIMSAGVAPFVTVEQRPQWEVFANYGANKWFERSNYLKKIHPIHRDALHGTIQDHEHDRRLSQVENANLTTSPPTEEESIFPEIFSGWNEQGEKIPETDEPGKVFAPMWQISPASLDPVNSNVMADPIIAQAFEAMRQANASIMSKPTEVGYLFDFLFDPEEKEFKKYPHVYILEPIWQDFDNATMVGVVVGITVLTNLFDRLVPEGTTGVITVLEDSCGDFMSFELTGRKALFLGYEDLHEAEFDEYRRTEENIEMYTEEQLQGGHLCGHTLHIYPSSKFRATYDTASPAIYTCVVALAFAMTVTLLLIYDLTVTRRQNKTMKAAATAEGIVTTLFPKAVGVQMVQDAMHGKSSSKTGAAESAWASNSCREQELNGEGGKQRTMAQHYQSVTIMFGDLVGFTAWSNDRTPEQVFQLLETIYAKFDDIARRRRIFKIETIGDCYVAVSGLPTIRKDHAIAMARFARDCNIAMNQLLPRLAEDLGETTLDLGIRIGLHSGPVTAGVLRGDRARYQLFGDSVNTTARIETSGTKNAIHLSDSVARLLMASGKGNWLEPREDTIVAKGKGELKTWWLKLDHHGSDQDGLTSNNSTHTAKFSQSEGSDL